MWHINVYIIFLIIFYVTFGERKCYLVYLYIGCPSVIMAILSSFISFFL